MPTYQYKREDGTVFEVLQGINDNPLTECPETGQKVTRLITGGAGVVYKGDGWYVTDYKRKEENGTAKNGNGSAKTNDKSSDSSKTKASAAETS